MKITLGSGRNSRLITFTKGRCLKDNHQWGYYSLPNTQWTDETIVVQAIGVTEEGSD